MIIFPTVFILGILIGMAIHVFFQTSVPGIRFLWGKKIVKAAVIVSLLVLVMVYLAVVFLAASNISNYYGLTPRPGYTMPEIPDECRKIMTEVSLNPVGPKRPVEYRQYANVWLWDGAYTIMYDATILDHPICLNLLLQRLMAAKQHIILVIYDRQTQSEALVIRNYVSINPSRRK